MLSLLWSKTVAITKLVTGFPWWLSRKESACRCRRSGRSSGGGNNPLQYSCLEIPWTEEPGGLQSMGLQRVRHDWAHMHTHAHNIVTLRCLHMCVCVCMWGNTPVCVMDTVYVCAVRDTWVSSLMTYGWVSLWWAPMCVPLCDGPRACWGLCIKSRLEDKSTWLGTVSCEFGCCFHHMLVMGDLEQAIVPVSLSVNLCWNDHGNHGQCLMSALLVLG